MFLCYRAEREKQGGEGEKQETCKGVRIFRFELTFKGGKGHKLTRAVYFRV